MFYRYTNFKSGAFTENGGPFYLRDGFQYKGFDMRTECKCLISMSEYFLKYFLLPLSRTDEIKVCGVKYMQYFGAYKQ